MKYSSMLLLSASLLSSAAFAGSNTEAAIGGGLGAAGGNVIGQRVGGSTGGLIGAAVGGGAGGAIGNEYGDDDDDRRHYRSGHPGKAKGHYEHKHRHRHWRRVASGACEGPAAPPWSVPGQSLRPLSRPLKNYLRCHRCVKNRLKMLI